MPIIALSTALFAAGSSVVVPFVNKVLEKTANRVGDSFDASLVALFTKAHDYLATTGREPQSVEPKILVPLVQAARLETDETLASHWAALLANAADPAQGITVQPGFAEILRQLMPIDAAILAHLYQRVRHTEADALFYELPAIITQGMAAGLAITDKQFALSVDTLLRLRLAALPTPRPSDFVGISTGTPAAARQVCPTMLGFEFLAAVTPPLP